MSTSNRHRISGFLLAAIFIVQLLTAEWHNYGFDEGDATTPVCCTDSKLPGLSVALEKHHCPLCDFHLSNTLLPEFNCIPGIELTLLSASFAAPCLPLTCRVWPLPESRGPPSQNA